MSGLYRLQILCLLGLLESCGKDVVRINGSFALSSILAVCLEKDRRHGRIVRSTKWLIS